MHELGITQNIVSIAASHAEGKSVKKVTLEIGTLSAVIPEAIKFCFDVCTKGTELEGAQLEIHTIEGRGLCKGCGCEVVLSLMAWPTCTCGSREIKCIAGKELKLKEMEVV